MEKLEGRDRINSFRISGKVNEIIDALEEKKIFDEEEKKDEYEKDR